MSNKPTLEVTVDFIKDFKRIVARFRNDQVLVGIPADNSKRNGDVQTNNATLLAINNFGSPARNIPARPIMAIGIRNAKDAIGEEFKKVTKAALSQGVSALSPAYNRIGIIASNSIKKVINSQEGIVGPSPLTLALRKSKNFAGTKALLVTGQLRNAITYVVKEEG